MGLDITLCLESKIDGRWTHLAQFTLRRDYKLFDLLTDRSQKVWREGAYRSSPPDGPDWSPMTKLLITQYGAHLAGEIDLDGFVAAGTERWPEQPRRDDTEIGPGRINIDLYFSTWLASEIDSGDDITLCRLFDNWPDAQQSGLGSEPRVCWWLT